MLFILNTVVGQRKIWIDVAKGIGIFAVVYGHVLGSHSVYLWHMPLFFMLAGYNYHSANIWQFLWKLTKRLLLPYFIVLFVCLFVESVYKELPFLKLSMVDALFGGARLKGVYAVFWFVTVLYGMLICLCLLSKIGISLWMVVALMIIGYYPMFRYVELPWNIQVVPMALAYGCMGYLLKSLIDSKLGNVRWYWIVIGLMALVTLSTIPRISINMKYNGFGLPIVSFLLSVFCVIVVLALSKSVEKVMPISGVLAWLGKGSMVIMYSHMFFNRLFLNTIHNGWVRLVLVLVNSAVVFIIIQGTTRIGKHFSTKSLYG